MQKEPNQYKEKRWDFESVCGGAALAGVSLVVLIVMLAPKNAGDGREERRNPIEVPLLALNTARDGREKRRNPQLQMVSATNAIASGTNAIASVLEEPKEMTMEGGDSCLVFYRLRRDGTFADIGNPKAVYRALSERGRDLKIQFTSISFFPGTNGVPIGAFATYFKKVGK